MVAMHKKLQGKARMTQSRRHPTNSMSSSNIVEIWLHQRLLSQSKVMRLTRRTLTATSHSKSHLDKRQESSHVRSRSSRIQTRSASPTTFSQNSRPSRTTVTGSEVVRLIISRSAMEHSVTTITTSLRALMLLEIRFNNSSQQQVLAHKQLQSVNKTKRKDKGMSMLIYEDNRWKNFRRNAQIFLSKTQRIKRQANSAYNRESGKFKILKLRKSNRTIKSCRSKRMKRRANVLNSSPI